MDSSEAPVPSIYSQVASMAEDIEQRLDEAIKDELESNWPVYNVWLRHVKGIGPGLSAQLLSFLLPPIPEKGPSSWYKAAGLVPTENDKGQFRLPRPTKDGGKITYHPYLRRCLYNVSTSFVRNGGFYRQMYDQTKARLVAIHAGDPNWIPFRIDRTARWKAVKIFLAHLWEAWSECEGLPSRLPYVVEVLGHQMIPRPMYDGKHMM